MADTVPAPLETAEPDAMALHPQQLLSGVAKYYIAFSRMEKAYRMVNEAINGKREMPILATLGEEQIMFDYSALVRPNKQEPPNFELLKELLQPWNNYFVGLYTQELRQLALFSRNAWCALGKAEWVEPRMTEERFEDLIEVIHQVYPQFEELRRKYETATQESDSNDPSLSIAGMDSQLSLSELLGMAGITDREQIARVGNHLTAGQTATIQQEILPCLEKIALAVNQALCRVDKQSGS